MKICVDCFVPVIQEAQNVIPFYQKVKRLAFRCGPPALQADSHHDKNSSWLDGYIPYIYKERYKETAEIQQIETVIEKEVNIPAKNSIFGIAEYGKRKTSFTNANLQKVFVKVFVKLVTDCLSIWIVEMGGLSAPFRGVW